MNDSECNAKRGGAKEKLMAFIDTERTWAAEQEAPDVDTRYLRQTGFAYCPICEKLVELVGFAAAADIFNTDQDDIESLAKSGELHRVHNRRGRVLICSDSLFRCFDARQTRRLDTSFRTLEPKA